MNGSFLEQLTDVKAPANLAGFRWSPDGKRIAYAVAANQGRMLPLPIYSGQFVTASPFPRSVAGDAPVPVQWYVVESTGDAPARLLDTGKGFGGAAPNGRPTVSI